LRVRKMMSYSSTTVFTLPHKSQAEHPDHQDHSYKQIVKLPDPHHDVYVSHRHTCVSRPHVNYATPEPSIAPNFTSAGKGDSVKCAGQEPTLRGWLAHPRHQCRHGDSVEPGRSKTCSRILHAPVSGHDAVLRPRCRARP